MNNLLLSGAALALAVIIGSIVFQSFIVAPVVFTRLDQNQARDVLRTLFPRFFRLNAGAGFVAAIALFACGLVSGWTTSLAWGSAAAAAIVACMLVSLMVVPSINLARDQGESAASRFAALHRLTVMLTLAALILAIGVLTTGAVEA